MDSLGFWWHLQWPQRTQESAANAKTNNTISINAQEYTALIINNVVALAELLKNPRTQDLSLSLLLFTENVASEAWIIKGAKKSAEGRALGCLQCCLMINNTVGINANQVSMSNNVIANHISQFPNHANPSTPFFSLVQKFSQLQHYNFFLPGAELVSCILGCTVAGKFAKSKGSNK